MSAAGIRMLLKNPRAAASTAPVACSAVAEDRSDALGNTPGDIGKL